MMVVLVVMIVMIVVKVKADLVPVVDYQLPAASADGVKKRRKI
jgi:hypothetical protein